MFLDELGVIGNHLRSDSLLLQLSVQRSPFFRRLVVVVDGSRVSQSSTGFSSGSHGSLFCWSGLFQRNGVLVFDRILAGVLFSVLDPLEQVSGLGLVFKQKACKTVLQLHRVKKRSVLEVVDANIQLLVPEHASRPVDVNELQKQSVAHKIVHQS